jgi:GNAT superfamily N-acetyltransferase
MTDVVIRPAGSADAAAVAAFCQPIYASVYPNEKYGMKPEHFSPEIFNTADTIEYFEKILALNDHQRAYVASADGEIIGSISIERLSDCYEIHGFYVAQAWQGRGVGRQLVAEARKYYRGDLPVHVEVAETNEAAIAMYQRWGFTVAPHLGVNIRHWPEWPEGVQNTYIYLEAKPEDLRV